MNLKVWLNSNKEVFRDSDLRFIVKNINSKPKRSILDLDHNLSEKELNNLENIKKLYIEGMPLAYILGKEEFFGLEFIIDQRVLIPRPETELIVEKAIELINKHSLYYILDLCTGSANIALSIRKNIDKDLAVFASDLDQKAIEVAYLNKTFYNAGIKLIKSDLFGGFKLNSFDLIVSNPPYVEAHNIKGTLDFEPRLALEGGKDGLLVIRRILNQAHKYLKNQGYLILEIGYNYKEALEGIVLGLKPYRLDEWIKDYSGHYRAVVLRKNN